MANPFAIDVGNPLQGLGRMGEAYFQREQQAAEKEQMQQRNMQTFKLLNEAQRSQDPAQREQLFMQAYQSDPQMVSGYIDTIKKQQEAEQVGVDKALTQAEERRYGIEDQKLKLRELELEANQASTELQRKKLKNQLKLQKQKIEANEIKAISAKNPTAKQALRDASEAEKKASSFSRRMIDSNNNLNELETKIDPTSRFIPVIAGGQGVVSEAANRFSTEDEQKYASAASDFVTAQLRKESGAAIGDAEFDRKYREFFPVPGDTEGQIAEKAKRREAAANDMKLESGGLYDSLYSGDQAAPAQPAQQYTEGQTARNPQTGEVLTYRGGKWQ